MTNAPKRRSRRKFLQVLAAASAASLAGPLVAPRPVRAATAPARRAPSAAVSAEIRSQKKSLDTTLATIRSYPLPTGSPMAFAFSVRAASPRRRRPAGGR